ncbi:ATP-grasp domain-containing protein [Bifidobacterium sp. SO1]|uniref:ATP-grasp domain-containing protein n=1 Tax=Bifidobacterium sp. SO1 TaxID=2809029 RepID=UPI001BDC5D50|nr:ATP-grasp domain-containing protein [Bifidobacterium sp. SO1]MBT1162915.1 ATP-grasp domain-containing protein [Bifidobacterium sp. SO1]
MSDQWLIDVIPSKCPADLSDIPDPYRHVWERYVGPVVASNGDRERWVEDAARLEAAVRLLPEPMVRVLGRKTIIEDADRMPHYGPIASIPFEDQIGLDGNADRYAMFPSLRGFLGRDVTVTDCDPKRISDAVFAMRKRHPADGLVVKFIAAPKTVPLAFIDPDLYYRKYDPDNGEWYRTWFEPVGWLDWTGIRYEGEPDSVFVQQRVRMRFEYRVFVIGGRPVCGAGCIENHTPLDNTGDAYDPWMEETRNNRKPESHPLIAGLYEQYAYEVAHAIRGDVEGPYTLDLYLGDDGQPHVLELNPMRNAGLYALNMDRLLEAVSANPGEFTPKPAPMGDVMESDDV